MAVMNEIGVDYRLYDVGDRSWNKIWPDLSLPDTHFVAHEPAPAGYVRPKRLIGAQNVLATNAGAQLIDDTVVDVARAASGFLVRTAGNVQVEAARVVVAAGAFSNFNGLVPRTLDMTLKSEVIVLGEVTPADAARLALYPTVKFMIDPGELESIYMVPPVRYNDGRFYIKMGANTTRDVLLTRLEDVQQWFVTDTDPDFLPMFGPHLQALWPGVDFVSMRTEPCVITRTPTSLPLIEHVVDGLFVAAGGNGAGAKGSDAWGERIADMIESQT